MESPAVPTGPLIDYSRSARKRLRMVAYGILAGLLIPLLMIVSEALHQLRQGDSFHNRKLAIDTSNAIEKRLQAIIENESQRSVDDYLHTQRVSGANGASPAPTPGYQRVPGLRGYFELKHGVVASSETLDPFDQNVLWSQVSGLTPGESVGALHPYDLGNHRLSFVRMVRVGGGIKLQGFVVDQRAFFRQIIGPEYRHGGLVLKGNIELKSHSQIIEEIGPDYGRDRPEISKLTQPKTMLFSQKFAAPFEDFELTFYALQTFGAGNAYLASTVLLVVALVIPIGLLSLYWIASSQISYAAERGNFVSAVSHELKSPLATIQLFADLLASPLGAEEQTRQSYAQFINIESQRLARLVSDILDLGALRSGKHQIEVQDCAAAELLGLVESRISPLIKAQQFEFQVQSSENPQSRSFNQIRLQANPDAVIRIAINLVDNALKFSKEATRKEIQLRVFRKSDRLWIAIRDFGPGVSARESKKIFKLFYRSGNELTRKTSGTGIGLALVKDLAVSMGAKIEMERLTPGVEFRLGLKLLANKAVSSPQRDEVQDDKKLTHLPIDKKALDKVDMKLVH